MGIKGSGSRSFGQGPEARRPNRILQWVTSVLRAVGLAPPRVGSPAKSPLERLKIDEWDHANVKDALFGITAALPHM